MDIAQTIVDGYRDLTGYAHLATVFAGIANDASAAEKTALFNRLVAQIPAGAAEDCAIFCVGNMKEHAHAHGSINNRAQLYASVVAGIAEKLGIDLHVDAAAESEGVKVTAPNTDHNNDSKIDAVDVAIEELATASKKRASKATVETAAQA